MAKRHGKALGLQTSNPFLPRDDIQVPLATKVSLQIEYCFLPVLFEDVRIVDLNREMSS